MMHSSIFKDIPDDLKEESFLEILSSGKVKIERIISKGHASPQSGWYDQEKNEWVMVIQGTGKLQFEDEKEITLRKGDYINIPKHTKHKVVWTDPEKETIWLAVFYD